MLTKEQFIDNLKKSRAISEEISKKYHKDELIERFENYSEHEVYYDLYDAENICIAITDYLCFGILPKDKTLDDIWIAFQTLAKKENWDIPDMKVSYDSEHLIEECLADIDLFGDDFMVFAKYQSFYNDSCEFIVDYVDADRPTRDEIIGFNAMDDEEDYQAMLKEYNEGIESLKGYRTEKMSLQALLSRLEQQNTIF
jgi:hypothetical protein